MTHTTTWKQTGLRLFVVLITLMVVLSGATGALAQEGPPNPPHNVDGIVQDQNGDAVSEITVQARYEDETIAQSTTDADGRYEMNVPDPNESARNEQVTIRVVDHDASETIAWESGGAADLDFSIQVAEDTEPPDGGGGDGDDGGDGAPGGTGGGTGGADDGADVAPPEAPTDVDVVTEETAALEVNDETDTTTATLGEDNTVESVAFDFRASGGVNARTLSQEPDETGPAPGASVTVSQITVSSVLSDSDATVRMRVTRDRLSEIGADAEDLTAFRFADGEWQALDTEVADENDQRVIVEFETSGFSYFAVSATGEPTAAIDAPSEVEAGSEVTLDASGSETEFGEIVSYDWSVGGESLSGETATATLDEAGDVSVELTVGNDAGETDTASATVTVTQVDDGDDGDGDGTGDDADGTGDDADEETDDGIPGFGPLVALVALVAAALLVTRRND